MLKKANRLAKAKEIEAVFARGRTFFNPFFTLKLLPSAAGQKFTFVVSTKVYKSAVDRNRLKRILRERVRKNLANFKTGQYVIIAKPKIAKLSEVEVLTEFKLLLGKVR